MKNCFANAPSSPLGGVRSKLFRLDHESQSLKEPSSCCSLDCAQLRQASELPLLAAHTFRNVHVDPFSIRTTLLRDSLESVPKLQQFLRLLVFARLAHPCASRVIYPWTLTPKNQQGNYEECLLPFSVIARSANTFRVSNQRISTTKINAEERTRTSTGFPPQVPETCVSTNFTTSAKAQRRNSRDNLPSK